MVPVKASYLTATCDCEVMRFVGVCTGNEDDWRSWSKVGDEVVHISLRKWADILLIAPLSANTLAKIAQVCN